MAHSLAGMLLLWAGPLPGACAAARPVGTVVSWGSQVIPYVAPGARFQAIAAGYSHDLALAQDGTVVAWGDNTYGQCVAPDGLSNVVAVAGGCYHSLALEQDGTVVAWGGGLDSGEATVPDGLSNVVAIAAGNEWSAAIRGDGTLVGWGVGWGLGAISSAAAVAGGNGNWLVLGRDGTIEGLGKGSSSLNGLSGVTAIAAGAGGPLLALKQDGTVSAAGTTTDAPPSGLSNVVAIAAGSALGLALKQDGTVVAWGFDFYGEREVPPGLSNVVAVAAGDRHSLALKQDGTLIAWGNDDHGQTMAPGSAAASGVVAIAAGDGHSLALKQDGTIMAWGNNDFGQAATPPADLTNVVAIACGSSNSLALKQDGTVVAWGLDIYGLSEVPAGLSNVVAIACGQYYSLAVKQDGTVVSWGLGGQANVPSGLSGVIAVAAGFGSWDAGPNLALRQDGTVVSWQSGGDLMAAPFGLWPVTQIAAGLDDFLALMRDGTPVLGGVAPYVIGGGNAAAIAARGAHVLLLEGSGTLVQDYWSFPAPAWLSASNLVAIVAGDEHGLAIAATAPVILAPVASQTVGPGAPAQFSVGAAGAHPLTYQWFVNGSNAAPDTIGPALELTNVQTSQAGAYTVVVANQFGAVTSAPAQLAVVAATVNVCTEAALSSAMAAGGRILFACDGTITLSRTIEVVPNTELDAAGHHVILSGGHAIRLFYVPNQATLTLTGLTLTGGCSAEGQGGAILNHGRLEVRACTFFDNTANGPPGSTNVWMVGAACGGAIYTTSAGTLIANGCTFYQNSAAGGTGALGENGTPFNPGGTSPGGAGGDAYGGAICNDGAATAVNCTFFNNRAAGGAGGWGGEDYFYQGGAKGGDGGSAGGAAVSGIASMTNCTVVANTAVGGDAGGGWVFGNAGWATGSGSTGWINTLSAGNTPADSGFGVGSLSSPSTNGLVGPLVDNGGPTLTMALLPGSAALGAADSASAPPTDQRGFPRPSGLADIGACQYSIPPIFETVQCADGGIDLSLTGKPGQSCRLLASPDLVNWTTIATNSFNTTGVFVLHDPIGVRQTQRFYRAVMP